MKITFLDTPVTIGNINSRTKHLNFTANDFGGGGQIGYFGVLAAMTPNVPGSDSDKNNQF